MQRNTCRHLVWWHYFENPVSLQCNESGIGELRDKPFGIRKEVMLLDRLNDGLRLAGNVTDRHALADYIGRHQ
jgi:hypothetical protein